MGMVMIVVMFLVVMVHFLQARAAGIRCGDGSDPTNLAARTFRFEGNKSLQQAQQVCPGLVTRPMRSDRYRQASITIFHCSSCQSHAVYIN